MVAKKAATQKVKVDALEARAQALKKNEVAKLAFDPLEGKRACRVGLAVLERRLTTLKKLYPSFDLAGVRALPELCDRIIAAQREVERGRTGDGLTQGQLSSAFAWRRKLLPLAQSLAEANQIPASDLKRILAGRGPTDQLQDVLELAELLAPHGAVVDAALGRGSLVTAMEEARAALTALGVLPGDPVAVAEAADRRDRYSTLVQSLHDLLRVGVAVVSTHREAATLVPSLAVGHPKARPVAVVPAPVQPPALASPG